MKIEKVSISKINPAAYNPRKDLKPEDPEYQKLKRSITEFGYVDPIVWNRQTGNLVGGHQRLKILIEQGLKEIDAVIVSEPLEREKVLNLALNKIQGKWDEDKLALVLEDLTHMPAFDTTLTGFSSPEISQIIDTLLNNSLIEDEGYGKIDYSKPAVTNNGNVVTLGRHKLLCGDSSKKEDLKKIVEDEQINLLVTDPPYNCSYNNERPDKKKQSKWKKIENDSLSQEEYEIWLDKVISNVIEYMPDKSPFYVWQGYRQIGVTENILLKLQCVISTLIVWRKPSPALSYADYNLQAEFALYGWKGGDGKHPWYGPANESTVWEVKRESSNELLHPTQKPAELILRAIKNSSKRRDIVFDAFLGSGTKLIASEMSGRRCYGIEIDPWYCDSIIRRYITFVGIDNVDDDLRAKYAKEAKNG